MSLSRKDRRELENALGFFGASGFDGPLSQIAKKITLKYGFSWTDPRTLKTYHPRKKKREAKIPKKSAAKKKRRRELVKHLKANL